MLCNQAVDYPKNGNAVDSNNLPRRLIPYKPDWKKGEDDNDRPSDFYRSERALGELYRYTEDTAEATEFTSHYRENPKAKNHPIYKALNPRIEIELIDADREEFQVEKITKIFRQFESELHCICTTHTLIDHASARLKEEEVVVGSISTFCSQQRWRNERIYRMKTHSSNLERQIRKELVPKNLFKMSRLELQQTLDFIWSSWNWIVDKLAITGENKAFGYNSFSFVLLNVVLECLEHFDMWDRDGTVV